MDSTVAGLIGAGIGAVAGMVGTIIGQTMQSQRDHNKWQLSKKEEAYSNTLRYLLKVLNRRSQITADGIVFISKEHLPQWFQDISEAQAWMTSLTIVCSSDVRGTINSVSEKLNVAMSQFLGMEMKVGEAKEVVQDVAVAGKGPDFGNLSEAVAFAYSEVLKCARKDLGKHIE